MADVSLGASIHALLSRITIVSAGLSCYIGIGAQSTLGKTYLPESLCVKN